ncbi:carboxypeptidase B-like [Ptychodera flava]|uniref:carboxypeptidase B-like n=1 Tax=Ptychodera flava TaxID=63121 RepID=UPI00396A433B
MQRLVVFSLCLVACMAMESFDGYKVLRMEVTSEEHIEIISELDFDHELDFWDFPRDLMVPPHLLEFVQFYLKSNEINHVVWIEDVQAKIDAAVSEEPHIDVDGFDYYVYHNYSEIMVWVDSIVEAYPTLASTFSVGLSHEGRDLKCLKIGIDTGKTKRAIWFNGAIHAREWVSPATVMWMTNALLSNHTTGTDEDVTFLLESFDMYILPVMNPDGYEYSWTTNRMWRKTRTHHPGDLCYGTDPNRNFDYMWGGLGASNVSCASTYRGPHALSEVEVKNVVEFIRQQSQSQTFRLFIDYHSYSQMMLSTWGHTYDLPPDYDLMEEHMKIHTEAIHDAFGANYTYGPGSRILYPVSGGSRDWGYGDRGIPYSYTIELRDTGEHGFLLPEDQIYETAFENYRGLIAGLLHIEATPVRAQRHV